MYHLLDEMGGVENWSIDLEKKPYAAQWSFPGDDVAASED